MPLPLYVPTEEQLLHPYPGDYWDGAVAHSPEIKPAPWWFLLIIVMAGLGPFSAVLVRALTR